MIALWGSSPCWQEVLRQEGVAFGLDARVGSNLPSLLVLDVEPDKSEYTRLASFVESGGLLLTGVAAAAAVMPRLPTRKTRIRFIVPDDSPLMVNCGITDIEGQGWTTPAATAGHTDSGAPALHVMQLGTGLAVLLPFDPNEVLAGFGTRPRAFFAEAPRLPYETVSAVDRGGVRRLVANSLRYLLGFKGLPYARLSYVPGDRGCVSGYRIDTDDSPARVLETAAAVVREAGLVATWFIHTGRLGPTLGATALHALSDQDIQLHCSRHFVAHAEPRDSRNIGEGIRVLERAGIVPVGFAAPYGEWSESLGRAIAGFGFEYSSEFGYSYDDLPSYPLIKGRRLPVLQVPVHPICLGSLARARASSEQTVRYFRRVIQRQKSRMEPVFLYDHPTRIASDAEQVKTILAELTAESRIAMTMTEYARWWRTRDAARYTFTPGCASFDVEFSQLGRNLSLVVEVGDRFARVPATSGRHALNSLDWQAKPSRVRFDPKELAARRRRPASLVRETVRAVRKSLQSSRHAV